MGIFWQTPRILPTDGALRSQRVNRLWWYCSWLRQKKTMIQSLGSLTQNPSQRYDTSKPNQLNKDKQDLGEDKSTHSCPRHPGRLCLRSRHIQSRRAVGKRQSEIWWLLLYRLSHCWLTDCECVSALDTYSQQDLNGWTQHLDILVVKETPGDSDDMVVIRGHSRV